VSVLACTWLLVGARVLESFVCFVVANEVVLRLTDSLLLVVPMMESHDDSRRADVTWVVER